MYNWHDLTFFLELARLGRLTPAARRLSVDYTTVSRRIAELEKSLGVSLFERRSEGFVMTSDGHRLFAIAEKMEVLSFEITESTQEATVEPAGKVRLATMEGIAAFYLSRKLKDFHDLHPNITVELVTERYLLNLTKREADVSLSFMPPAGPRLTVDKIGQFGLGLFASREYLDRRGVPLNINDLNEHDFVDYVSDMVEIENVHWLLDVLDPENVVFRSTSMAAQQRAAASGFGIALLPFFSAKTDPALIQVLPNKVLVKRDLWLSAHEDTEYLARIKALLRFLREALSQDSDYLNELA
ncbi:DNA-binding transcriptional regulator, LysR family [Jannaschia faecimaris]|uniref:DNA-binding transcriptional regulator, LysR family n=1 Tax=Jannaschia faecimaris TaxID=1244108 RepID=A0A1H3NJP4_9RHOB|nr:LysR family transcriptional regulator [Jannaschia faecimaris]SDY89024.1 DNA-binding transcriptional regulator, LysR family [Jannaschia faecimaris]